MRDLWCNGEKALVFCFYVETGRALRSHISRALRQEVISRAAIMLRLDLTAENEVLGALDRIGERLLRSDSRGYSAPSALRFVRSPPISTRPLRTTSPRL